MSLLIDRYRRSCKEGVERLLQEAQEQLDLVVWMHALILQQKEIFVHDHVRRQNLLRRARRRVRSAKIELEDAKAEYKRVMSGA